jgi:adenine phosphoribosyltransferase
MNELKTFIRDIPDFPKKGIIFKDITTLLKSKDAFKEVVDKIVNHFRHQNITSVVCVEARGFVLGSAVAYAMGCGIVPIRKKGKLPYKTYEVSYELEYGKDFLQIHQDALKHGEKILLVDDLLATGGTTKAVLSLLKKFDAEIAGVTYIIELSFLKGRDQLNGQNIFSLLHY